MPEHGGDTDTVLSLMTEDVIGERVRDNASPTKNETANFGPAAVVNNTPDTVAPSVVSTSATE